MIDKNGNKIIKSSDKIDKDFAQAEIRFIAKGFENCRTDSKAESLAVKVSKFLQSFGETEEIREVFLKLEDYIQVTKSDDFVWEMVYILRQKARKTLFNATKGQFYSTTASYFDRICLIAPTVHNHCCRVWELIIASKYFFLVKSEPTFLIKSETLLSKARSYFEGIEDNGSIIYSETGLELCSTSLGRNFSSEKEKRRLRKEILRFSRDLFFRDSTYQNLETVTNYYDEYYLNLSSGDQKKEADNIQQIITIAKKTTFSKDVTLLLSTLKNLIKKD